MHRRFGLTDFECYVIEQLLLSKSHGTQRVDARRVTNGVLWRFVSVAYSTSVMQLAQRDLAVTSSIA